MWFNVNFNIFIGYFLDAATRKQIAKEFNIKRKSPFIMLYGDKEKLNEIRYM